MARKKVKRKPHSMAKRLSRMTQAVVFSARDSKRDKDGDKNQVNRAWRRPKRFHNGHVIVVSQAVSLRSKRYSNTSKHDSQQAT